MLQSIRTDVAFRGLSVSPFTGTPPCVLGARTVIYGRNGSGKTTLSEVLRLAAARKADSSTVKARVVLDGVASTVDLAPATMPFQLFVYNRYYVEDALQLFLDGRGEALPILKLGERNVQTEIDIRGMRDYLSVIEQRRSDLAAEVKTIGSARETIEKQTKADIIAALAPADSAYYNPTRYQVTIVRQRLRDGASVVLSETQLAVEQAAATAQTIDPIPDVQTPPAVATTLHTTINDELLGIEVESVQLPRLTSSAALSDWVEAGLALHQPGDLCRFCQAGTVTASTLDAYRQHFSAALEALRDRLTKAITYLEGQEEALHQWSTEIPENDKFLPDFREYRRLAKRLESAERANTALTARQEKVHRELLVLEQSQQDVGRMANLIDADLRDHFGHAHLRVSVSADGKGYVVTRSGEPAARLSEGERNAIAFSYFLRSLEGEGVEPSRTVVVIDDPVTSLDKEALFAAFALAESRTRDIGQVIVLTHDYEYFRLQLMEYTSKWHSSQKRIARQNDAAEKLMPAVSLLEIRAMAAAGSKQRQGEIRQMPRSLIQHPSEYHFLFLHVAEAVQGTSGEYLPLVGNAGRRLLEGFLSFRAPNQLKFQDKVDAVAHAASIDSSLKERVVKFLHSQSHREEPRPSAALDFPSIEAELVATLSFIHKGDEHHFNDMCAAVQIDPAAILQSFAAHGVGG